MIKSDGNRSYTQMFNKGVDLSDFNTLGIPAKALLYTEITGKEQLTELAASGFFEQENWFVFGGGSNVLFKSNLDRAVIRMAISGIRVTEESDKEVRVQMGAGEDWHGIVEWAVYRNYGGIENLALIPGTAGAAPIQNIGAYGAEFADVFEELELYNPDLKKFQILNKEECRFGYRDSIFKHELKGKAIITGITLRLTKSGHAVNSSYASLENYFEERGVDKPQIKDVFEAVVNVRKSKLPDPELIGNAGSFFKNPVVGQQMYQTLKNRYSEMPSFRMENNLYKIPAGWLIEKTGWKGKRIGNVGCYKNQALVIVNHGGATGEEIMKFAAGVQKSVSDKFGIDLVPEVNIID